MRRRMERMTYLKPAHERIGAWPHSLLLFAMALGLLLPLGCHSLKLNPLGSEKPVKSEKEAPPAAPCKNSFRVSQYVFLSDMELNRDLPIFQELAELRE